MQKIGFDNEKYLKLQSEHIVERISKSGNKLYLEFGGKLFDDYHASRVLPGFAPDSKMKMLLKLQENLQNQKACWLAYHQEQQHSQQLKSGKGTKIKGKQLSYCFRIQVKGICQQPFSRRYKVNRYNVI